MKLKYNPEYTPFILTAFLIVLLLGTATIVLGEELVVTDAALAKSGIVIRAVTIETGVKPCTNPSYEPADTNQNGELDRVCVGLRYDPCNRVNSVAKAYYEWQQDGKVCYNLPLCSSLDFSPQPPCRTGD